MRELSGETGEFGHLGTALGELPQEGGVLVPQVLGTGEEEAGEAPRGGDGPVTVGAALGDVADQEVRAPGVTELPDLAQEVGDGHRGVLGPAQPAQVVAVGIDQRGFVAARSENRVLTALLDVLLSGLIAKAFPHR